MFQLGTIEPRATGVASNGYLRRKTGQKRFCKFVSLEHATRNCSILMAFVDLVFPQESLAAQGFSNEQIEDIMKLLVPYDPEKDPRRGYLKRHIPESSRPRWVFKNPKTVYRVVGLQVTVCLIPYIRYVVEDYNMGYEGDDFACSPIEKPVEAKPAEPDSFDMLKGRGISFMGNMPYYNTPWPADTRWSILMPTREFYQHIEWEITRLIDTGSMTERTEKVLERHTNSKQSYFDSSAYIYYP